MVKLLDPEQPSGPKRLARAVRAVKWFWRPVTALDVDGHVLRVVQTGRRGGGREVTRYVAEELGEMSDSDRLDSKVMGTRIREALKRLRVKPKAVVMGLPRAKVVLRTLQLPAPDDPRELAAMVHFQVAKDLPFPIRDAVIDFKLRGDVEGAGGVMAGERGGKPKVELLVAAARREEVRHYEAMAAAAGLRLAALGLRSYANARCVGACKLSDLGEHVALVSLRPDEVIIDVLEEQALVFSRVVAVGRAKEESDGALEEAGVEARSFGASVTIEVIRSLHSYEGMIPHKRVSKVVVAGGTGDERVVVEALQNRLSIPCYLLNPARALGLPESNSGYAPGAMAVFGLGLGVNDPEGLPFDFLKPKRPRVVRDTGRVKVLAAAAAVAVVLMVAMGIYSKAMGRERGRKSAAQKELQAEREKSRKIYRPMIRQVKSVKAWVGRERRWLNHVAYLSKVLPSNKEIYLRSISTSGERIRLAVQARSSEVLSGLDRQLRAAGYDVEPISFVAGANSHGYPFQTTVELSVPAKMEIKVGEEKEPETGDGDGAGEGGTE